MRVRVTLLVTVKQCDVKVSKIALRIINVIRDAPPDAIYLLHEHVNGCCVTRVCCEGM